MEKPNNVIVRLNNSTTRSTKTSQTLGPKHLTVSNQIMSKNLKAARGMTKRKMKMKRAIGKPRSTSARIKIQSRNAAIQQSKMLRGIIKEGRLSVSTMYKRVLKRDT